MEESAIRSARALRRQRPGAWAAAAVAAILALSAIAGSISAAAAAAGVLVLALIAAASYAIASRSPVLRVSEDSLTGGQLAAAFLLFAWLSSHGGAATAAIPLLYPIGMLYGALSLGAVPLVILAAAAMVMHGTALFLFMDAGGKLSLGDACSQIAALALLFAWIVYASGELRRLRERLAEARGALHEAGLDAEQRASRDSLTGAYHHRHLMEALEREIARAERIGKPLSVARVDLDWLGSINQHLGHVAGDVALRRFTIAAGAALRDVDLLGRYGGKEFLVLMPDTDLKGAVIAAQRVLKAVGLEAVPEVAGRTRLSCTLGVAEHRKGENTRLVIGRAEAGLNYAKAAGRGRVVALEADGKPLMVESA